MSINVNCGEYRWRKPTHAIVINLSLNTFNTQYSRGQGNSDPLASGK